MKEGEVGGGMRFVTDAKFRVYRSRNAGADSHANTASDIHADAGAHYHADANTEACAADFDASADRDERSCATRARLHGF